MSLIQIQEFRDSVWRSRWEQEGVVPVSVVLTRAVCVCLAVVELEG